MPSLRPLLALAATAIGAVSLVAGAEPSASAGSTVATSPLGWRVLGGEEGPFQLAFVKGGRTLTAQSLGDGLAGPARAFSYVGSNGTFHALTRILSTSRSGAANVYRVATTEPGRSATVTVRPDRDRLRVSLRLRPEEGVAQVFQAFTSRAAEHFLGTGQRPQWVDLRGTVVPLKVFYGCRSTIAVPFFLSSAGYGIRLDTTAVGMIAFPGGSWNVHKCDLGTVPCAQEPRPLLTTRICVRGPRLDFDVFAGGPEQVVRAHSAVVGRPVLPPPSQLALIKWRDYIARSDELLDDITQLRTRGIPIGWVLLDNPWERGAWGTGCSGSLTFDSARLGDPKQLIDRVHARGVRFMLWLSPQVRRKAICGPPVYARADLVSDRKYFLVDLTKPRARAEYVRRLDAILRLGVDGVKTDRGDEVDLEPLTLDGGPGIEVHNRIPRLYAEAVASVMRRYRGANFAQLNRAGVAGSQRTVRGTFGGDLPHDFRGLQEAVRMVQNAGVSGFPIWGVDVGGYAGDTEVTSEVLVRWAQFSALTPIFEVGGQGLTSRFWKLGEPTVKLFRRAAVLHYELFPYLYELARRASRTGVPIVRPLGFRYPRDERAWQADQQFLVGNDLLAAPVTTGARQGSDLSGPPSRWRLYVPAGAWVDVYRRTTVTGRRTITRSTPIRELPLYLRRGAAIPFNLRTPQVWASRWDVDDLDRAGRGGWLYAPGAGGTRRDGGAIGTFSAERRGRRIALRVRSERREIQVSVLLRARPCSVSVEGRRVPETRSLAALRRTAAGWTFHTGPFGGVLLKLTEPSRSAVVTLCD